MQNPTILRQWPYIRYVASREPMHIACHDYFHNYPYGVYLSDLLTWAESPHLTSRLLQTERRIAKKRSLSCVAARLRDCETWKMGMWPSSFREDDQYFIDYICPAGSWGCRSKMQQFESCGWRERKSEMYIRKLQRRSVGIFDGKQGWDLPNRLKIPPPPILPNPPSPNRLPHTNIRTCRRICT